jgi:hypothetical protein
MLMTPPPFRRTECDGHHTALLRRNGLSRLPFRVVATYDARDRNTKPWMTLAFRARLAKSLVIFVWCRGAKIKTSNCQFVHWLLTKMKC